MSLANLMEQELIRLRHIRVLGFAFPEMVMTLLLSIFLTCRYNNGLIGLFKWFFMLVGLAIVVHYSFGVNTELNYLLGLSCQPDFNSLTGIFPCHLK